MSETVIDIKTKKRRQHAPRDLVAIDKTSGPARYRAKMKRDIESDLGGRRNLSRMEIEQIDAFCGVATLLKYYNHQIDLGDDHDVDPANYATLASTMLRLGSKLGLKQRSKADATPGPLGAALLEGIERQQRDEGRRLEFEMKAAERAAADAAEKS
jgi:hypothetical protein